MMRLYLDTFAQSLPANVHVVLVLDKAGWHVTGRLKPPDNITLVHLPAYSPELNPVERLWLYLKERFLSHRIFDDQHAIVEACAKAWNDLKTEAGRIAHRLPLHPKGQDLTELVELKRAAIGWHNAQGDGSGRGAHQHRPPCSD